MLVNYDPSPYPETKAVYVSTTQQWQAEHSSDVTYMELGQYVTPVNAAMYAKLKYTIVGRLSTTGVSSFRTMA